MVRCGSLEACFVLYRNAQACFLKYMETGRVSNLIRAHKRAPVGVVIILACGLAMGCQHEKQGKALVWAAASSTNEVLVLLSRGADINAHYKHYVFGWTPLISAIYQGKEDVVDLLLDRGADVNIVDGNGESALEWAIKMCNENTNLIARLIEHGADPYRKGVMGEDAFSYAYSQSNSNEIVKVLQETPRSRRD